MVYLPVVGFGLGLGLALGGRLGALAELRLRGLWLFYAAIALQIGAFPWTALPWDTSDDVARWLWLASYAVLACAAVVNRRLKGVPVIAAGMFLNLAAIVANGGHMPALPEAARAAGMGAGVHQNSITTPDAKLAWLVDRWAAPDWLPFANVYSVGDVVLAVGGLMLILYALQVPLLQPGRWRRPQSMARSQGLVMTTRNSSVEIPAPAAISVPGAARPETAADSASPTGIRPNEPK